MILDNGQELTVFHLEDRPGVAWRAYRYLPITDEWGETGDYDPDFIIACMVGDDRNHTIPSDLPIPLDEDAYCACCGQIGCPHG